jgi:hypothetical protein
MSFSLDFFTAPSPWGLRNLLGNLILPTYGERQCLIGLIFMPYMIFQNTLSH